ncbi:MAG: VOC family protein [Nocardioidaceae bacterium]
MSPTLGHGKVCYLEIPATDIAASVAFYKRVFHWQTRERSDGAISFDDPVNEVSGTWVLDRAPMSEPGLVVSIMVADAAATIDEIKGAGGEIARPLDPGGDEVYAWFRDPAGNVLGIYQQAGLAADGWPGRRNFPSPE